jgi:CRP-like cAMP-binding protein
MSHDGIDFKLLVGQDIPTRSYKAGEIVFREGDPATELFIIKEGRVDILSGNRLLDSIDGNGIFGEMALIDAAPRSASAVAASDVTVVPVSEKQFLFLVSQTPFFALNLLKVLARRLRATNKSN